MYNNKFMCWGIHSKHITKSWYCPCATRHPSVEVCIENITHHSGSSASPFVSISIWMVFPGCSPAGTSPSVEASIWTPPCSCAIHKSLCGSISSEHLKFKCLYYIHNINFQFVCGKIYSFSFLLFGVHNWKPLKTFWRVRWFFTTFFCWTFNLIFSLITV